jgi:pSer/pThr/pTyr-binding forkhead associated (FHA) protein
MTTILTVGRSGENQIVIDKHGISRKHARLTFITDNMVLLEDLESTYGTMVDGRRYDRTIIGPDSKVVFGQVSPLDWQQVLTLRKPPAPVPRFVADTQGQLRFPESSGSIPRINQAEIVPPAPKPKPKSDPLDFREEFTQLAQVHEMYMNTREAIQTKDPIKQAWVRSACGLIPILGVPVGQLLAAHFINIPEKLLTLDKEFKRTYVCPNPACGEFLGNVPYNDLTKRKQCRTCKAKWAD